jgi:hypothetical protein
MTCLYLPLAADHAGFIAMQQYHCALHIRGGILDRDNDANGGEFTTLVRRANRAAGSLL